MPTLVVHVKLGRWTVYVGRGRCPRTGVESKWGNKFSHKAGTKAEFKVATREEAIERHREWLFSQPELMAACRRELRGETLGCWCAPKPCHASNLAEAAESEEP